MLYPCLALVIYVEPDDRVNSFSMGMSDYYASMGVCSVCSGIHIRFGIRAHTSEFVVSIVFVLILIIHMED